MGVRYFLYVNVIIFIQNVILFYLFSWVFNGFDWSLFEILFISFFMSLLMSFSFLHRQQEELESIGFKPKTYKDYFPHAEMLIENTLSLIELKSLLASDENLKTSSVSETPDSIHLKTRYSSKSWGEKITVKRENSNQLKIESKPIYPLTLADSGINRQNVMYVVKRIKEYEKELS